MNDTVYYRVKPSSPADTLIVTADAQLVAHALAADAFGTKHLTQPFERITLEDQCIGFAPIDANNFSDFYNAIPEASRPAWRMKNSGSLRYLTPRLSGDHAVLVKEWRAIPAAPSGKALIAALVGDIGLIVGTIGGRMYVHRATLHRPPNRDPIVGVPLKAMGVTKTKLKLAKGLVKMDQVTAMKLVSIDGED